MGNCAGRVKGCASMCLLGSPFQINHDEIEVTYCPKYRNQSMLLPHANVNTIPAITQSYLA